jgi:hypothetical protein
MSKEKRTIKLNGKVWRLASIRGGPDLYWAWLVNVKNPNDQIRFSYQEFKRLEQ